MKGFFVITGQVWDSLRNSFSNANPMINEISFLQRRHRALWLKRDCKSKGNLMEIRFQSVQLIQVSLNSYGCIQFAFIWKNKTQLLKAKEHTLQFKVVLNNISYKNLYAWKKKLRKRYITIFIFRKNKSSIYCLQANSSFPLSLLIYASIIICKKILKKSII